ncbi:MAG: tetratricopeptide repeat protein [Candidatus Methylomirabilales bacterium]
MTLLPDIEHIQQMETTLAQNPLSLVFAQLADAYRRGGRLEQAIQLCQEGLTHHVTYASAYMVLGRSLKEKGDLLAAREAFQRVLRLDPESVLAHHFLGEIAEARDEFLEALDAYRAALIFHPFDKEIQAAVERLQARTEAQARAVPPEAPAVHQGPSPPQAEPLATETLGDLYAAQGLHEQAAEIYGRVMADTPDREDLAYKHQDALAHGQEPVGRETSASLGRDEEALHLLETWRDTFARLRTGREGSAELLEAWRDAFRKLKKHREERFQPRETQRDAFGKLESRRGEPVALLEAWRDAFRRLKSPRGGTG